MRKQALSAMYRKRLVWLLGSADDEMFVQLVWAFNLIQGDNPRAGLPYVAGVPQAAVTSTIADQHFIYKWELETVLNELLRTPKRKAPSRGPFHQLDCKQYKALAEVINKLRKLENAEAGRWVRNGNILDEMPRIAARQFEWQRGWFNKPQFYRSAFIYGQGACSAHFEHKHGLTVNQFSLLGFVLHAQSVARPIAARTMSLPDLDLPNEIVRRGLDLMSLPMHEMRSKTAKMKISPGPVAHRPSLLRQYPCIAFGEEGERIRSPLSQLVVERVTSGIFYDVVDGGWNVRQEYGVRFEEYGLAFLRAMLPSIQWEAEHDYQTPQGGFKSPDILWCGPDGVRLAIECKATRLSHNARFADDPLEVRGYGDLVKAVFQIWRYFSHCRRKISGRPVRGDAMGMVLTLDDWLVMANSLIDDIVRRAEEMAAERDPNILPEDKRPIFFCPITSLEDTLNKAGEADFWAALELSTQNGRKGWRLAELHAEIVNRDEVEPRPYPFEANLGEVLPWWDVVGAKMATPGQGG